MRVSMSSRASASGELPHGVLLSPVGRFPVVPRPRHRRCRRNRRVVHTTGAGDLVDVQDPVMCQAGDGLPGQPRGRVRRLPTTRRSTTPTPHRRRRGSTSPMSCGAALEDYILEHAATYEQRLAVFAGLILLPDDPTYRGAQMPLRGAPITVVVVGSGLRRRRRRAQRLGAAIRPESNRVRGRTCPRGRCPPASITPLPRSLARSAGGGHRATTLDQPRVSIPSDRRTRRTTHPRRGFARRGWLRPSQSQERVHRPRPTRPATDHPNDHRIGSAPRTPQDPTPPKIGREANPDSRPAMSGHGPRRPAPHHPGTPTATGTPSSQPRGGRQAYPLHHHRLRRSGHPSHPWQAAADRYPSAQPFRQPGYPGSPDAVARGRRDFYTRAGSKGCRHDAASNTDHCGGCPAMGQVVPIIRQPAGSVAQGRVDRGRSRPINGRFDTQSTIPGWWYCAVNVPTT